MLTKTRQWIKENNIPTLDIDSCVSEFKEISNKTKLSSAITATMLLTIIILVV